MINADEFPLSARGGQTGSHAQTTNPVPALAAYLSMGAAIALVLAVARAAAAQDGNQTPSDGRTKAVRAEFFLEIDSSVSGDSAAHRQREIAEDMAVMGKLVDQSLAALYTSTGSCGECHGGTTAWSGKRVDDSTLLRRVFLDTTGLPMPEVSRALAYLKQSQEPSSGMGHSPALSAYLDGYGVVYQLEAPAPAADAEGSEQAQAKCPFLTHTPWERAQLQLRGQWKIEQCQSCHTNNANATSRVKALDLLDLSVAERALDPNRRRTWLVNHSSLLATKAQLVQTLLDVLAENGHNFRHLAPDEHVAVALTLRTGAEQSAALRQFWQWMSAPPQSPDASPDEPQNNEAKPEDSGSQGEEASPDKESNASAGSLLPQNPGGGTAFDDYDNDGDLDLLFSGRDGGRLFRNLGNGRFEQAELTDNAVAWPGGGVSVFDDDNDGLLDLYVNQGQPTTQELTGDLYMRQRNYAAAVQSYEKALQEAARTAPTKDPGAQRRLYNKLIQALVAAGRFDRAKQLLDVLAGAVKPTPAPDQARKPAEPPAPRLPARLVVSATKAQLDAVHAGELGREELAKQAMVQYVDPNPAAGNGAKGVGEDSSKE